MNKYFKILIQFKEGECLTRYWLVDRFGEQLVDEVIKNKYIIEVDKSQFDEPRYIITKLGLEVRDK